MPSCCECQLVFHDFKSFLSHLKNDHTSLKQFHCCEDKCNRTFSVFNSYYKHCIKVHKDKNGDSLNTLLIDQDIPSISCSDKFNSDSNVLGTEEDDYFDLFDDFPISEDDDEIFDHSTLECQDEEIIIPTNLSKQSQKLNKQFINFAAEIYSFADINRKKINKVIKSVNILVQTALNCFKEEIGEMFQETFKKCDFITNLEAISDNYKKNFTNFSS